MATMMTGRRADVLAYTPDRSRWATVRVETDGGVYVGRIYVPDTKQRVSDVLADDRQFLSRLTVSALALEGHERQEGYATGGGSVEAGYYERERTPEEIATEAAGTAISLLGAREPQAGV